MPTTQDDFEYWLADMDDALDRFFAQIPGSARAKLDYAPVSLDVLEAWLLSRYANLDDALRPTESLTMDGVARYIGETFRKNLGGHWEMRLDDPKYAYYGIPQLTGFSPKPTPVCPATLATAALDRREGNYWSTILGNMQRRLSRG